MKTLAFKKVLVCLLHGWIILLICRQNVSSQDFVKPPDTLIVEGVPAIPSFIKARFDKGVTWTSSSFLGWSSKDGSLIGNAYNPFFLKLPNGQPQTFDFIIPDPSYTALQPKTERSLLYLKDNQGDDKSQLYKYDFETRQNIQLTKSSEIEKIGSFEWSANGDEIFISNHKQAEDITEIFSINPENQQLKRLLTLKGETYYLINTNENYVIVKNYLANNHAIYYLLDLKSLKMTPFTNEESFVNQAKLSKINNGVWFLSNKEGNFFNLYHYNIDNQTTKKINKSEMNISDYSFSPNEQLLALETNDYGANTIHIFEINGTEIGKELPSPKLSSGVINKLGWRNNEELGFDFQSTKTPSEIRSYNIKTGDVQTWVKAKANQDLIDKVEDTRLIKWKSFDKRELTGFLLEPKKNENNSKFPVIIDIHGGPKAQFQPNFNSYSSYFVAELQTAIIFPNIRGSSGFGREFEDLDNQEKREDAVKDLQSLLDWIKTQPQLDADKVFIKGESFGGFMALALGLKEQTRIKGIIAEYPLVSIKSDLLNTSKSIQSLWEYEYGSINDTALIDRLEKLSLLNSDLKDWKIPVILAVGKNDTRVSTDDIRKLRDKFRASGKEIWFIEAANEGHGFVDYVNYSFLMMTEITYIKSNLF